MPNLVTLEIAAERLGIHISTIRAWVRSGRIPSYRSGGRFVRVDLDAILDRLSVDAAKAVWVESEPSVGVRSGSR